MQQGEARQGEARQGNTRKERKSKGQGKAKERKDKEKQERQGKAPPQDMYIRDTCNISPILLLLTLKILRL